MHNSESTAAIFFIFTDYMRAAMRLAAISQAGVAYILSHDSIGLGGWCTSRSSSSRPSGAQHERDAPQLAAIETLGA
jgi:hypothetical protein